MAALENGPTHALAGSPKPEPARGVSSGDFADDTFSMQWVADMLPIMLFLLGVAFGTSLSRVIRQLADRDLPTVDGAPDSVRLWHHGKVIQLTPDATRRLANDLLGRAEEIEFPGVRQLALAGREQPTATSQRKRKALRAVRPGITVEGGSPGSKAPSAAAR